ncbi:MAG TPA: GIY-YIG nuclease family protein [Xanthomonadales bacterium]|nr:GIY-YIG nuclease family protein [Xanthomonadales bacterium]
MRKQPCVYILASRRNGTIYVGVTSSIRHRAWQHRTGLVAGFTKKYGVKRLVHHEHFETMREALTRENQLKSWSRRRKLELIETSNKQWRDLFEDLFT